MVSKGMKACKSSTGNTKVPGMGIIIEIDAKSKKGKQHLQENIKNKKQKQPMM